MKLNLKISMWMLICGSFFLMETIAAQPLEKLSLVEAYDLLEANYPILQNAAIHTDILQADLAKLDAARLPSLQWKADGRLQSESTQLDAEGAMLPFEINQPLVAVRSYVEANYVALDGGANEAQRQLKRIQTAVNQQETEVERFHLRERINQLFLSVTLLRAHSDLLDLSLENLAARKEQIAAGVEFGTILESELSKIEVRELELLTKKDQLEYQLAGAIQTLEQLTGAELSEQINLQFPELPEPTEIPDIHRPEQELFQLQREAILAQSELIDTERRPKLHLFAQAGLGYPNPLNILDNELAPFALVGAGFSWQITDWKKNDLDKQILSLQAQKLDNAEQTFEFNLETREAQYRSTIERLQAQIQRNEQIARLQADILQQVAAQVDEGVINSSDYLEQLNAELAARQNVVIHELELLQTQLQFWNERGALQD